jgi:LysM repeat protein
MKPINRLFLFLLFISASYAISYAQENQSFFLHTIEKGQSLYSISKMYNVTTSDIIRLNPGCDEKIYAGQTIKIPKGKDTQKGETFHTIQAGETLYKLTTMYNVSAKAICEANPGLSAENFRIGQVILIPLEKEPTNTVQTSVTQPAIQGPVVARCKEMHKVKRKETIFSVSREYEISEQELINANPELKKGMKKGQLLCIPYPSANIVSNAKEDFPLPLNPGPNIHLFGYPEWQTNTKDHLESFFELDVYFYSSFYTNTLFPAAVQFTNAYHKWYSKDLASKYPNYAMLGFDTGFFFLKGLSRYGSELENNMRIGELASEMLVYFRI